MGRGAKTLPSTLVNTHAIMCCCGRNFHGDTARVEYSYKLHRKFCNLTVDDESDLVDRMNDVNRANFNINSRKALNESTFVY